MDSHKVQYEKMFPEEIVEAREKKPVAYLPIGTLEWHGEHNVLGLDAVKAHALAIECAKNGGGLVFPPLFFGEPRENYLMEVNYDQDNLIKQKMNLPPKNFQPGYMEKQAIEADIQYVQLLIHILKEIKSLGFKVITIIAGHYPLLTHARAASEIFNLHNRSINSINAIAWAISGYELVRDILTNAGDHAGAWETSLMMKLCPDLVDLSRLPKDLEMKLIGVLGQDPRIFASKEYGEKGVTLIVERVTQKVEEFLKLCTTEK